MAARLARLGLGPPKARVPARKAGRPKTARRKAVSSLPLKRELKVKTTAILTIDVDSTPGSVTLLNGILQGDDYIHREGRQVQLVKLRMNAIIIAQDVVNSDDQFCRVALIYDKFPDGIAPSSGEIFGGDNALELPDVQRTPGRFLFLRETTFALNGFINTAATENGARPVPVKLDWNVDLKGRMVQYIGTTVDVASILKGGLFLVVTGSAGPAGNHVMSFQAQLRFFDS